MERFDGTPQMRLDAAFPWSAATVSSDRLGRQMYDPISSAPDPLCPRLGSGIMATGCGALAAMPLLECSEIEPADLCEGDNPNVAAALSERFGPSMAYL